MGADVILGILMQVSIRYSEALRLYGEGDYDAVDKELSELRDVLDDIHDRPEEEVEPEPSGGG